MSVRATLVTLAVSSAIAAYLFYALVPVPSNMQQRDDVFYIFLKRKLLRGLSTVGEYLGFGHRIVLVRTLATTKLLSLKEAADYTDVKAESAVFDGVPVRVYTPKNRVFNSPAFIWIHGGGWTTGSAEADEFFAVPLARKLNILIVSVNYRLAPEFVFPAGFDDCVKATIHFMNVAATYDVDPKRVAIGGASSGGNLAAAVSLRLRDLNLPVRPLIQVLIVPCLQAVDFNTPSYQKNANNGFLPSYWMVNFWLWYAHGPDGHRRTYEYLNNQHTSPAAKATLSKLVDHSLISRKSLPTFYVPNDVDFGNATLWDEIKDVFGSPYFAPLMARDLRGLPQAYIATAEHDVLRDDGIMYARRLASEGEVDVVHHNYEQGYHALNFRPDHFELSKRFNSDLVEYLSSRL